MKIFWGAQSLESGLNDAKLCVQVVLLFASSVLGVALFCGVQQPSLLCQGGHGAALGQQPHSGRDRAP